MRKSLSKTVCLARSGQAVKYFGRELPVKAGCEAVRQAAGSSNAQIYGVSQAAAAAVSTLEMTEAAPL